MADDLPDVWDAEATVAWLEREMQKALMDLLERGNALAGCGLLKAPETDEDMSDPTPYSAGIDAWYAFAFSGRAGDDPECPFPSGSAEAKEWDRGYYDAMSDWEADQEGARDA